MASMYKDFDEYKVFYTNSSKHYKAFIYLYHDKKYIGSLGFLNNDKVLPDAVFDNVNSIIRLHYHISNFGNIVEILRQEKPLRLYCHSDGFGWLTTSFEPIGEEEGLE